MTDTNVDPDAPTEEHATILAKTLFAYLDLTLGAVHDAQKEILEENPEVMSLDGPRLKEAIDSGENLSLSGDFLSMWGAARSLNGAYIELENLYQILQIFFSIKEVAELDVDLEAILEEITEEGKGE